MSLFCSIDVAAHMMHMEARQFRKKYVETEKIRLLVFENGGHKRVKFLTSDVEKLKK